MMGGRSGSNRIGSFASNGRRLSEAAPGRWVVAVWALASALLLVPPVTAAPTTKFVSKQYGYSVALPGSPSSWSSSFALVTWSAGSIEPRSPAFDTFTDTRADRLYLIAARRPPTGPTLAKWTAFFRTAFFTSPVTVGCQKDGSLPNSTLSGVPARVFTYRCSDVPYGIGITAIHDHLGYMMLVASQGSTSHASDRSAFDAARRSFRFSGH
jgi:hypothetical protein